MSTQKYHHHIATNTWQSNKIRTQMNKLMVYVTLTYINLMQILLMLPHLKALTLQFMVTKQNKDDNLS